MKPFLTFLLCFCALLVQAQRLVKDLNTGPKGSNPREFAFANQASNYYTYFIADSYSSNHTAPSIWYSANGGTPSKIASTEGANELVVLGSTVYFTTDGSYYGAALNKLTSPTGGVDFIEYIFPQYGFEYDAHDLIVSGNKMYLFSNNSLWVSQGTEATTNEISTSVINPQELTAINSSSSVIFSAENASGDREVIISNGTTVTRYDLNLNGDSDPRYFADLGAVGVLFSAYNGSNGGHELFKYDGSNSPTLFKNINPGGGSDPKVYSYTTTGFYYVAATTANEGRELWKTDGTAAGTVLVEDINPGTASSDPDIMIMRGSRLFFAATHPDSGRELWKSEGTAATTSLYQNFGIDYLIGFTWYINSGNPKFLTASNFASPATFYLSAQTTLVNTNLYNITSVSNQPPTLTLVKSVGIGSEGTQIGSGNTIFFSGWDAQNSQELWKSDGTESGTALLKNIYEEPAGSYPNVGAAVNLNGNLIFAANDGTNGRELFKSDGTATNTLLLKDCYSGEYGSSPKELTKIGNYVYFSALGGPRPDWWGGYELWRTDGTTNGTVFIKDVNQSHISSEPRSFRGYNNEVYFVATEGSGYKYIYKTNGNVGNSTTVITVPVAEDDYTIVNGMLIFIKNNSILSKQEVWQKNLSTGVESLVLSPSSLFVSISHSNSNYAFLSTGGNVYSYNGSTLTNILSGFGNNYVSIGSNTYFTYNNSVYKTDGTSAGTMSIKSFPIDAYENETIHSLVNVNGSLAFAINTYITDVYGQPVYKGYIYKSDGTAAGTALVSSYTPFPGSSNSVQISMGSLTAGIGNKLYYVVRQNSLYHGSSQDKSDYSRLMVTDLGTNTNQLLMRVSDINGHFYQLHTSILVNNKLFFSLNDHAEVKGGFGNELWVYDINCPTTLNVSFSTPPDMGRTLQASNAITSNAKIFANEIPITTFGPVPAQVDFRASQSVTLLPGFEVPKNKIFKAEIGGCN